jgi:uncharacterized membrane protein YqjE
METPSVAPATVASKRFARRLLAIGQNRVELALVELQEERERVLQALLLTLGVAVLGLLAGIGLMASIVVFFWEQSHLAALFVMTLLLAVAAWLVQRQLAGLKREWQTLPETCDQLRKDRQCLERLLD